jgi:hypothetical protein
MKWTSAGSFAYLCFPVTPLVVVRAVHVLRSGNKGVSGGFEFGLRLCGETVKDRKSLLCFFYELAEAEVLLERVESKQIIELLIMS